MNCPDEVRNSVLQIIYIACLSIRLAGSRNDARYCAIEANHIHNLPGLLMDFDLERLSYYLEVSRADYIEKMQEFGSSKPLGYEESWRILDEYAGRSNSSIGT